MICFAILFLCGDLVLQQFSYLPDVRFTVLLLLATLFFLFIKKYFPIGFLLGFAWALCFAHLQLNWQLPKEWEGKNCLVKGIIASLPNKEKFGSTFLFSVKQFNNKQESYAHNFLIRLMAPTHADLADKLHVGDEWIFQTRLKRIHSQYNPGGFDFEAWAIQEKIRATGYIVPSKENKLINNKWTVYPINRIREFLQKKIAANLAISNTSPWITALIIGERQGIDSANWEVLRNTGTNHLMAIAGLHIGIMSGFAYIIINWFWRKWPGLMFSLPAHFAGSIASMIMALIYSALAGFSLPTQRACIMLCVFLSIILCKRNMPAWHAWSLALIFVLLINPFSVLTESFWLSFSAVALIIYGMSARLAPTGFWWKWGRIQWLIGVGLIPMSIWLFQQCSLVSFIANSITIPLVGFLVVPLCLTGAFTILFSETLGSFLLTLADKILGWVWLILDNLAHFNWSSWYQVAPAQWTVFLACLGIVFLFVPKGFPGRWYGLISFLPLFCSPLATPKAGEVWFTLLDVGQGLACVVQTAQHLLIFDTGAKLSDSFDMGESVIVPFLRTLSTKKIDMLIVSHGDNDHIGGSQAIIKKFPISVIKTSVIEKFPNLNVSYCKKGERWSWDQINFEFLYPSLDNLGKGNDSSCVLRVSSGEKHLLLTGDIEKYAEKYLIEHDYEKLLADILVAPHHGSKTSGEKKFIQAVKPKYVLFPIGYRNRYRFPHVSVVEKYDEMGAIKLDSAQSGAIQFSLNSQAISQPELYRNTHRHYWLN